MQKKIRKWISGGNVRWGTLKINRLSLTSVFANALFKAVLFPPKGQSQDDVLHSWFFLQSSTGRLSRRPLHFQLLFDAPHKRVGRIIDIMNRWFQKPGFSPAPLFCYWGESVLLASDGVLPGHLTERATAHNPRTGSNQINDTWRSGQMFTAENGS